MLMSKSRLEKFLYALYSLDYSDLPTPQSRIEELYKCLVTGEEAPTFEPISRVEKYLMAILGVYDVNELPNPLSRVEVLLYKLAIGDDNLDDIKSFLSEHEELLAEIIRNGGAGGNINIEYVLYTLSTEFNTLYNTAEKPIKSAILTGQTLVNIVNNDNWVQGTGANSILFTQNISIKKGQTYTVVGMLERNDAIYATGDVPAFRICTGVDSNGTSLLFIQQHDVVIKQTFTNNVNDTIHLRFFNQKTNYKKLMIIEGDYTNVDIPYFEGMQSVKMPVLKTTGKNLFDGKLEYGIINGNSGLPYNSSDYVRTQDFIPINCEKITYTVINEQCGLSFYFYDKDKKFISSMAMMNVNGNLSIPEGVAYLKFRTYPLSNESVTTNLNTKIQIEEGSLATKYEPYKSTTVTCNEEIELRGIGDVKDELNLLTGEVVQSIYNLQLTGYESWGQSGFTNDDYLVVYTNFTNNSPIAASKVICDKLNYDSSICVTNTKTEGINIIGDCSLRISLSKTKVATLNDFINWIRQEQPVVNFVAKEKSVKTVDLSVVDQDGNDTELSTFDDLTHVTLSSEGLIPESEMEVATKNKEVLSTMSFEMNDISTTQTTLEETSNAQSENVYATMIATTEIYEELL